VRWAGARAAGPGAPPGLSREGERPAVNLRAAAGHDDLFDEGLTVVDDCPPNPPLAEQLLQLELRTCWLLDEDGDASQLGLLTLPEVALVAGLIHVPRPHDDSRDLEIHAPDAARVEEHVAPLVRPVAANDDGRGLRKVEHIGRTESQLLTF